MTSEKFLAIVGVDEVEVARIRLTLRAANEQLPHRWKWTDQRHADLVIIDPANLQGQMARDRAYSSGLHCAVFSATEPLRAGEVRLKPPVDTQALVDVLTGAALSSFEIGSQISQHNKDFYDPGVFEPKSAGEAEAPGESATPTAASRPNQPSLDELLRFADDAEHGRLKAPRDVDLESHRPSATAPAKFDEQHPTGASFVHRDLTAGAEGINLRTSNDTQDAHSHTLREVIAGNLLGGPASVRLPDTPELTLDPKTRLFYADAPLSALAGYCLESLAPSQWDPVTTSEFTRLRSQCAVRPYEALLWLDALVHSDGHLTRHLDPGGRYRLRQPPGFESDFPGHNKILQTLEEPHRLNEIASAAGVSMSEVFDLINALDTIGLIEVSPRAPRHGAPPNSPLLWLRKHLFGR